MPTHRITDSTLLPISIDEAKAQCEIELDETHWDDLLTGYIHGARHLFEGETLTTMLPVTWELAQDRFTPALRLEYPRARSVTSLTYVDTDGVTQTLDPQDYELDSDSSPGWIVPAYGKAWPDTRPKPNAVRVRYVAGLWETPAEVSPAVKLWMQAHVAHAFQARAPAVALLPGLRSLIQSHYVYG